MFILHVNRAIYTKFSMKFGYIGNTYKAIVLCEWRREQGNKHY